ncbi:MAG: hypothetical protein D6808_01560 [Candidatus Dadabacteria bacterium]|nr:MAG: hypothetical protein D6808_01560 [Candidatus Dadabacteria bacterium]
MDNSVTELSGEDKAQFEDHAASDDARAEADSIYKAYSESLRSLGVQSMDDTAWRLCSSVMAGKNLSIMGFILPLHLTAIGIGFLERLKLLSESKMVVIVCGDDTEAESVGDVMSQLSNGSDIEVFVCLGGDTAFSSSDRIIIGSADRVLKCIEERIISLSDIAAVYLKGLDRILDGIDKGKLADFIDSIPEKPQVLYSALSKNVEVAEFEARCVTAPETCEIPDQADSIEHFVYEVGSELLDKTNAISSLLETFGSGSRVLVVTNTGSDVDLVQAVLKKRGFAVEKVVTDREDWSASAMRSLRKDIEEGAVSVLVTNDASIQDLDPTMFEVIIHYGIPEKPEQFLDRFGSRGQAVSIKESHCLVNPLDFTNFHYLKKVTGIEFVKSSLPTSADIDAIRLKKLFEEAKLANHLENSQIAGMVDMLEKDPNRAQILALLLHEFLVTVPELKKEVAELARKDRRSRSREPRGDIRKASKNVRKGRKDTQRKHPKKSAKEERQQPYRRERNRQTEPLPPAKKDVRMYIGHGSEDGFSEEEFVSLVKDKCGLVDGGVKRFSLRKHYSFADFAEEQADSVLTALEDAPLKNGEKLFIRKATTISLPRETSPQQSSSGQEEGDGENAEQAIASAESQTEPEASDLESGQVTSEDGGAASGEGVEAGA